MSAEVPTMVAPSNAVAVRSRGWFAENRSLASWRNSPPKTSTHAFWKSTTSSSVMGRMTMDMAASYQVAAAKGHPALR
jgi:hypothetical protein